jgi:hypothetical protein
MTSFSSCENARPAAARDALCELVAGGYRMCFLDQCIPIEYVLHMASFALLANQSKSSASGV